MQELQQALQECKALEAKALKAEQHNEDLQRRLARLNEDNSTMQQEYADADRLLIQVRQELEDRGAEVDGLKQELMALEHDRAQMQTDIGRLLADQERLTETLHERDALRQTQRGQSQEVDQMRAALEVLRHDKERLSEELLAVRSSLKREERNHAAQVDDLQRQLDVQRAKAQQESEALATAGASAKHVREEAARLQREVDSARAEIRSLNTAQAQVWHGHARACVWAGCPVSFLFGICCAPDGDDL